MPVITEAPPASKRRRLPGLNVRPGAIKQARLEAGLTLAQVAAGRLSRTAVHLAETGKTRPTLPTIELIAVRTGKPVAFFLAATDGVDRKGGSFQLDRLRELAAAERFPEVLAAAQEAAMIAPTQLDEAWARYYSAMAQVRLANPRPALVTLREVSRVFQAAGDRWMVVECMDWESAALYLLEDSSALAVAETALAECRLLQPNNRALEARILGRLASIHVVNDSWARAIDYYNEAIEVAGDLKDLSRLGKMYNDLSIAYERMGDFQRARLHSQKAISIHELLQDHLSVARAENNLGLVLIRQGELEQAREHLHRSLQICEETGLELGKGHVLLTLAELEMSGGDPGGARAYLTQARDLAAKVNEMGSLAQAHHLLGMLAEATGSHAEADRELILAISIFEGAGLTQRLVSSLAAYGKVLEERGNIDGALEMMKRAVAANRPDLQPRVTRQSEALSS
jgi:tetratricopeptide (TPR) repeat protein